MGARYAVEYITVEGLLGHPDQPTGRCWLVGFVQVSGNER